MARNTKYLKIGKICYTLKSDTPITKQRMELLRKHPQSQSFHFKTTHKMFWWYVRSRGSSSGISTTEKRQNQSLVESGKKFLNKKDYWDN